jgi:hypothetical protein
VWLCRTDTARCPRRAIPAWDRSGQPGAKVAPQPVAVRNSRNRTTKNTRAHIWFGSYVKGAATLYLFKITPDGIAFVSASSNERNEIPSATMRFPVPNSTG